ncbi:uncharacterized protein LOC135383240 [Ornithodoros turicata]|uniref:uncharacterized protein LOC135383240 n=1 Tax=Ornithodoros turicata TaxID=34597 RepID=UPI0031397313
MRKASRNDDFDVESWSQATSRCSTPDDTPVSVLPRPPTPPTYTTLTSRQIVGHGQRRGHDQAVNSNSSAHGTHQQRYPEVTTREIQGRQERYAPTYFGSSTRDSLHCTAPATQESYASHHELQPHTLWHDCDEQARTYSPNQNQGGQAASAYGALDVAHQRPSMSYYSPAVSATASSTPEPGLSPSCANRRQHENFSLRGYNRPNEAVTPVPCNRNVNNDGQHSSGFEREVLKLLHTLKISQQSHSELLNAILEATSSKDTVENQMLIEEPFKSLAEFLAFEEELGGSSEKRDQLMTYMKSIGGTTSRERTLRIMARLLDPSVGKEYSLYGAKGKRRFCDLRIWKIMCCCLAENCSSSSGNMKDVENATMSWLRHAPQANARHQRKDVNQATQGNQSCDQ